MPEARRRISNARRRAASVLAEVLWGAGMWVGWLLCAASGLNTLCLKQLMMMMTHAKLAASLCSALQPGGSSFGGLSYLTPMHRNRAYGFGHAPEYCGDMSK